MTYTTLLYYQYIDIPDPEKIRFWQMELCQKLNLKGRILLAKEGINGTLEGSTENAEEYITQTISNPLFSNIYFKKSSSDGNSFDKLTIKVRKEVVSTHLVNGDKLGPHRGLTGKYLSAQELNQWIQNPDKEFYIVDMRNDYEHAVGHFEGSILPSELRNFRDLPKILPRLESLKNKTIVTVCTGGIRCEKASGFLIDNGFNDVYQLKDGIVSYMEKYPNQDFKGKLYVFDNRVLMGFNLDQPEHEVVGRCSKCGAISENLVNYKEDCQRKYGIICPDCIHNLNIVLD